MISDPVYTGRGATRHDNTNPDSKLMLCSIYNELTQITNDLQGLSSVDTTTVVSGVDMLLTWVFQIAMIKCRFNDN